MSVNSIWVAGLLLLAFVALAAPGAGLLVGVVVVILLLFRGAGEQIDAATQTAIDDAETPAETAAAAGAGCGALLLLAAVALLALAVATMTVHL